MYGQIIKSLRKENGYTQAALAKKLNFKSASAIGMIEREERELNLETLKELAELFNVSTDYILNGTNDFNTEINISKEYKDKYKVTSKDKKQYLEEMKKSNEAFFMNDELNEEAKKEMLDLMSELFWKAKCKNKEKRKKNSDK